MKNSAKQKGKPSRKIDNIAVGWCKQGKWLVSMIEKLDRSPSGHGLKWTQKMMLHYKKLYDELRENTPQSCTDRAADFDRSINAIFNRYSWEGLI